MTGTTRVNVNPDLIKWARKRSRISLETLEKSFPSIKLWEKGTVKPTFKQLEKFAKKTHTPFGYFFLQSPPKEELPLPDFRTLPKKIPTSPSPELLDTIYICQQRQEWYREYLLMEGIAEELEFVGSANPKDSPVKIAENIRKYLRINEENKIQKNNFFRYIISQAEEIGILVMISSIVGNNTHRKLNLEEFRGFVLIDKLAPVIFINGADTKTAQLFTLAHELAHIWLGRSGVVNSSPEYIPKKKIELWCNQVAAEILVPLNQLERKIKNLEDVISEARRLAKIFKVSSLVILRRLFDLKKIDEKEYWTLFKIEQKFLQKNLKKREEKERGGNFKNTLPLRTSEKFTKALLTSTFEGNTLLREAQQLLQIKKLQTLESLANHLGILEKNK